VQRAVATVELPSPEQLLASAGSAAGAAACTAAQAGDGALSAVAAAIRPVQVRLTDMAASTALPTPEQLLASAGDAAGQAAGAAANAGAQALAATSEAAGTAALAGSRLLAHAGEAAGVAAIAGGQLLASAGDAAGAAAVAAGEAAGTAADAGSAALSAAVAAAQPVQEHVHEHVARLASITSSLRLHDVQLPPETWQCKLAQVRLRPQAARRCVCTWRAHLCAARARQQALADARRCAAAANCCCCGQVAAGPLPGRIALLLGAVLPLALAGAALHKAAAGGSWAEALRTSLGLVAGQPQTGARAWGAASCGTGSPAGMRGAPHHALRCAATARDRSAASCRVRTQARASMPAGLQRSCCKRWPGRACWHLRCWWAWWRTT
jgi:hypothetical protein